MIYWDHNAGTSLRPEVAELLARRLRADDSSYGNPSSIHGAGRKQRALLEDARARVAKVLGCEAREIVFTGSGSESNALALKGSFESGQLAAGSRLVTTAIEHPSTLGVAAQLEKDGVAVDRVAPETNGLVSLAALETALAAQSGRAAAGMCSVMAANNETGVIQPAGEVARLCRRSGVRFHCDAVQAAGRMPLSLRDIDADLMTLSGHKLGAPPGVAVLVVRRGIELGALTPGHQENGRRGGTQNIAYAEAFALALELAAQEQSAETTRLAALRDSFETTLLARVPDVRVNGAGVPRLPHVSNLEFVGADGEALLIALDLDGIQVSSGAACASGTLRPSHVLTSMGRSSREAQASVRFSLGRTSIESDVQTVLAALERNVPRAREALRTVAP